MQNIRLCEKFTEVLDIEYFNKLSDKLSQSSSWEFANTSGQVPFAKDGFRFWYNELIADTDFTGPVFDRICELTNRKFKLYKVAANGQTYGQPGHLHIDLDDPNGYTFLLYMNNYWHLEWGGPTIIYDHERHTYEHVLPFPNTGILFKGSLLHFGSEPTRHFTGLRMSVAYKIIEETNG